MMMKTRNLMNDTIHISLPNETDEKDVMALTQALQKMSWIEDAGFVTARGIDPGNLTIWVQLISSAISTLGLAVTLIERIIKTIRNNRISGASIRLPNGMEICIDKMSTKDIIRLLQSNEQEKSEKYNQ